MDKTFRDWNVDEVWLFPPSIQELVPEWHLANLVRDTVRNTLDLSAILDEYPTLRAEHIPAAIGYAADLARERIVPVPA